MPFILNNKEEELVEVKVKSAMRGLVCTSWTFVMCTFACVIASKAWITANIDGILGKFHIFDFIPYLFIVCVLIYSSCKINIMLKKDDYFQVNKRLYYISVLVCISYLISCINFSFEGRIDLLDVNLANELFEIFLFIFH